MVMAALVLLLAFSASLAEGKSKPPKCISIPAGIAKNPSSLAMEMMASTLKLTASMMAFNSLTPATKYWEEVRCLGLAMTDGKSAEGREVELFKLQQVIKDVLVMNSENRVKARSVAKFIQAVETPEAYGFLVNEIKENRVLHFGSGYLFEVGLVMKNDSTLKPDLFDKILPQSVRRTLQSHEKPVFLKNEETGNYLNFRSDCESCGEKQNCSSFSLSKERGEGWKFLSGKTTKEHRWSSPPTLFEMYSATNDTPASIRIQSEPVPRDPFLRIPRKVEESSRSGNSFQLFLEEDEKLSIRVYSENYGFGSHCLAEGGKGEVVVARSTEDPFLAAASSDNNCTKWAVLVE